MIRTPISKNFNNKTELLFQIIDWKSCDIYYKNDEEIDAEESEEPSDKKQKKLKKLMIRGYGVTDAGNSISIHVDGFQPFFYFKIGDDWTQKKFDAFKQSILTMVDDSQKSDLVKAEIIQKKEFYGFTNNELFKYGLFQFKNQATYYTFLKIMKEKRIKLRKWNEELDFSNKLYETKVSSLLRFFHVRDIDPSGWLKVSKYTRNSPSLTRAQIDITLNFNDISKVDMNMAAKIIVASYDIECCSEDGSFPKFDRPNDPVIQIGTTVYFFGEDECKLKYIATLKKCDPIEDVIVESFNTEKEVILGWAKFISKLDPDIITGYNIWGFDWEYIFKRAKNGSGGITSPYHDTLYKTLQRFKMDYIHPDKIDLTIQDLSSSALGVNILKYIDIEGIVQIDLLKVVQRDHKLDSYKLDNVAKTFMKQQKVDLSPKELFKNFKDGSSDKIKEIAEYCIMDCKLVNDLINKLQVITNNLGMSNVCVVPFSYLFLRGQGIKIFSLVAKFCREENFLIKNLLEDDIDKNSYEGAIVFVPVPGVYFEPVVVMDYNSLYPSSMIAENISHDSIVGYKEYKLQPKIKSSEEDTFELVRDTINKKYNSIDGYHYIDIEYDTFEGMGDDKKKVGYKVCTFAEADNGDKSVLPRILRKLLKARKDTRKIMEYKVIELTDGTTVEGIPDDKDETHYEIFNVQSGKSLLEKSRVVSMKDLNNDFQKSVLDGLQLAYKVTCNSLYGQVGATTSPICYKELAACTTATGRKMVVTARDLTLNTFAGAKLTYGDSVTGDTPLLVMKNGFANIVSIEDLNNEWVPYEEFKPMDTNRREKQQTYVDYKIWTNEGWAKINRVIRHKTVKKLYRIRTEMGVVDVTEDHSLLDINKKIIKPMECTIGTELLHGYPGQYPEYDTMDISIYDMKKIVEDLEHGMMDCVPYEILNGKKSTKLAFLELIQKKEFPNQSKIFHQGIYYLKMSMRKVMPEKKEEENSIRLNGSKKIVDIQYLRESCDNEYVYDIETESGNFQAGIGQLIVKNTDSIFVNFTDVIRNKYPDRELSEKELLIESIKLGELAAKNINSHMKAPQNIEYEKTFWPFCIFSKKRYFGNKYEHNPEKYKQTSMGIVLKRRDNAPIVKTIYGGVIDIILNKRNIEASKTFFYNSIKNLIEGKVDITELIISKTIRTEYANPNQIAHKVLGDRMGERDPGNKPQSNDRIPYCYIESSNLLCKICNTKVNPDKCKCITCMNIYCATHLNNHRDKCVKICRFCKLNNSEAALTNCLTCRAWYCNKCHEKHKIRTDKYKKTHNDKCKKELTNKLLQGDTIEHPAYILEKGLKIDYEYYLVHQIEKPVFQIFELVMKNPASIIENLVRDMKNKKNGNHTIKDWLSLMSKPKPKVEEVVETEEEKNKKIIEKINALIVNQDEEENMLNDQFEEDEESKIDEIIEDPSMMD
jgi:DNA polymerase elongation subunit (family B)